MEKEYEKEHDKEFVREYKSGKDKLMYFNKLFIYMITTFCMVSMLVGCGDSSNDGKAVEPGPNQKKIVDSMDREVIIDKNPENIAAIFSPAAHTIAILGGSEKIQSVSSGNMRDKLLLKIYPEIADARTPKGGGQFNIEEMIKKPSPDVIICDAATANDKSTMNKIEKFHIPVVVYDFTDIESQKKAIKMVGEIIEKQEEADKYCEEIDNAVTKVSEKVKASDAEKGKTIYHAVNELLRGDIEGTVPVEIIKKLELDQKGVRAMDGFNDSKNYISLEDLFSYDPDYIIVNGEDVYDYIQQSERLHVLESYKTSNIYNLPVGISRWGQPNSIETALFIKWLGKTVYPEVFEDMDMKEEVREFYKKFADTELSDEIIEDILSGRNLRDVENIQRQKDDAA